MAPRKGTGCCCAGSLSVLFCVLALALNELTTNCGWNELRLNDTTYAFEEGETMQAGIIWFIFTVITIIISFIGCISSCISKLIICKSYTYLIYLFALLTCIISIIIWIIIGMNDESNICNDDNGESIGSSIWLLIVSCLILLLGIISSYKRFGSETILMNLPENVKYIILEKSIENEQIVKANIDINSLFVIYKINENKLDEIKKLIPKHLDLIKHKIYESDDIKDHYLMYNIYMSYFDELLSIRLEINVICYNKATNNNCFVIIDYYTDKMRFDPIHPFGKPNCKSLGYNVSENDKYLLTAIQSIDNNKNILFKYCGWITDERVKPDHSFLFANNEFYFGGNNHELLDKYGFTMFGQFDANEHNNYFKMKQDENIDNLFTDIQHEYITSFIIPNKQYYEIKLTSTKSANQSDETTTFNINT